MSEEQIAFQITHASVDSGDSRDRSADVERILGAQRVLAAVRGFDGQASVVLIPVTDDAKIVALDQDGQLRFDLHASRLQELLAEQGLTLHLGVADDAPGAVDAQLDEGFGEAFKQLDDPAASPEHLAGFGMLHDAEDFDELDHLTPEPVRVIEFSRRGPWAARLTAQILDADVEYLEAGSWSLYRYRTDRAHGAISGGPADGPIIEVNIPQLGEAWVEVTTSRGEMAMFWPNADRLTRPVLDIDAIAVPESAELYRRMLAEADGVREELAGLGIGSAVDADAVRRACMPEALGGVAGEEARLRALVVAFGVPAALAAAGIEQTGTGRRFTPRGWMRVAGDLLQGGVVEASALTRRDHSMVRFARFLRKRPLLGAALSTAELAGGVALGRSRSRLGRSLGILFILDALVDLVIWALRIRRR